MAGIEHDGDQAVDNRFAGFLAGMRFRCLDLSAVSLLGRLFGRFSAIWKSCSFFIGSTASLRPSSKAISGSGGLSG